MKIPKGYMRPAKKVLGIAQAFLAFQALSQQRWVLLIVFALTAYFLLKSGYRDK